MPLGPSGAGQVALEHKKPLLAFRLPQPPPQHLEVKSLLGHSLHARLLLSIKDARPVRAAALFTPVLA